MIRALFLLLLAVAGWSLDSVPLPTNLRARTGAGLPAYTLVQVLGLASVNDGGGAMYYWNPSDTTADDGVNVIQPNYSQGAGRWNRLGASGGSGSSSHVTSVTAPYTVTSGDGLVLANATSGGFPVTLSAAAALGATNSQSVEVARTDTSTNTVNVYPPIGNTLAGGVIVLYAGDSVKLRSDGVNTWRVLYLHRATATSNGSVSIIQFGADPTGVSDSAPAIQAAFNAGATSIYVPPGHYMTNTYVTMQDNQTLYGAGGEVSRIEPGLSLQGGITVGSFCTVRGISVDCTVHNAGSVRCIYFGNVATSRTVIEQCQFWGTSGTSGLYAEPVGHADNIVRNCFFNSGGWGCQIYYATRWSFLNNQFRSAGHAISVYGAASSHFIGNNIVNGTTGILGLSWRSNGVTAAKFNGNVISGNTIFGTSEEGISFDCNGNTPTNWPENGTNPIITYSSSSNLSSSQTRINCSETGQAGGWANSYFAIPLNGHNIGMVFSIVGSASGSITVDRSNGDGASWSTSDKLLITGGIIHNAIVGNTIEGSGTGCIVLWGSHWHNLIANNTIVFAKSFGMQLACPVAGLGSSGAWGLQAWSGFDVIRNNTINCSGGDFTLSTRWPIYCAVFREGSPIPTSWSWYPGTIIDGNIIDSSQPSELSECTYTTVTNNQMTGNASWEFDSTDHGTYGFNSIGGLPDFTGPTLLTTHSSNTNLVYRIVAAQANIGAAPTQTDFNTLLTNLRAAQVMAP